MGTPDFSELYAKRAASFDSRAEELGARSRLVSNLRGLFFGIAAVAALFALFGKNLEVTGPLALLGSAGFVALLVWHARVISAEDEALRWATVNRDAHARCTGRWRELPDDGSRFVRPAHPYVDDLDVFGQGSLFQRISVTRTRYGQDRLAEYLSAPGTLAEIRARQQAVKALAPELDTRQRLEALGLAVVEPNARSDKKPSRARVPPDPEPLLRWAEGEPKLSRDRLLVWAAHVLPPMTVFGLSFGSTLGLPSWVWAIPLVLQLLLTMKAREEAWRVFTAVSSTEGAFLRYGGMLELLENLELDSSLLREMRERLRSSGQKPSQAMQDFRRKVGWFDLRHNGLIHPIANLVLLWDIHCVLMLERWQRRSGRTARNWFTTLGELETLSSFAGLAHDEPDFVFPEVVEGPAVFAARELGHPLIDRQARVPNDVLLPEPGTALLVTGSNMSGKSTLLRAMGLSAVMALAGGPVCAAELRTARFAIRTSIRVSDSLESGVSHFYAELRKLKAVVDAATTEECVLFLLDEILHGTNSRERQIGARWVMSELLRHGAVGAVSTHDMALCQLTDELMQRVTLVHFRENVENDQMTFDYKLRPGPVIAGNALRLMQLIGLAVPLE